MSEKKHILITGTSSGIGAALLEYLNAQVEVEKIWAFSREKNPKLYSKVTYFSVDFLAPDFSEQVKNCFTKIEYLDGLIHNAGFLLHQNFEQTTTENWQKIFQINFFAAMEINRLAIPMLKKAKKSSVIHLSSMGGVLGSVKFPGLCAYSASKAALANATEVLAAEYAETNIYFNALALGAVQTEMLKTAFPNYQAPFSAQEMANFIGDFVLKHSFFFKGKILPVSISTP